MNPGNRAHGAINNIEVGGGPTWVVPRENAMAILGLIVASEVLEERLYLDRAQLAADYLISIQDPSDGGWYNHYSYTEIVDYEKSPTQTAEVMIALYKLGYDPLRYEAMKKGAVSHGMPESGKHRRGGAWAPGRGKGCRREILHLALGP
jgi:hypothetical protein